MIIGYL